MEISSPRPIAPTSHLDLLCRSVFASLRRRLPDDGKSWNRRRGVCRSCQVPLYLSLDTYNSSTSQALSSDVATLAASIYPGCKTEDTVRRVHRGLVYCCGEMRLSDATLAILVCRCRTNMVRQQVWSCTERDSLRTSSTLTFERSVAAWCLCALLQYTQSSRRMGWKFAARNFIPSSFP